MYCCTKDHFAIQPQQNYQGKVKSAAYLLLEHSNIVLWLCISFNSPVEDPRQTLDERHVSLTSQLSTFSTAQTLLIAVASWEMLFEEIITDSDKEREKGLATSYSFFFSSAFFLTVKAVIEDSTTSLSQRLAPWSLCQCTLSL